MTILEDGCCAVVPEVRGWGGGMRWGVASLSTASTFGVRDRWRSAGITIKNPLKLLGRGGEKTPAEEIEVASTESATNVVPASGKEWSFPVMG